MSKPTHQPPPADSLAGVFPVAPNEPVLGADDEPAVATAATAATAAAEPVALPVPEPTSALLWQVSTDRQPVLTIAAADATAAKRRYADLLGVRDGAFGNPVSVEPAPAGAVESVWPPKE